MKPAVTAALLSYTGGNPLHLQTLLAETDPGRLMAVLDERPVPATVSALMHTRLTEVPSDSRELLEALAVLGSSAPLHHVAQVAGLDDPSSAAEPVLDQGFVTWTPGQLGGTLTWRHEIGKEAVYIGMSPVRRRTLHAAAAEVGDAVAGWRHRVAAADSVDPVLAEELDFHACDRAAQGEYTVAHLYLTWAAELSATRTEREERFLRSVAQLLAGLDLPRAEMLITEVLNCSPSPLRSYVLGSIALVNGDKVEAIKHLRQVLDTSPVSGGAWVAEVALTLANIAHSDANGIELSSLMQVIKDTGASSQDTRIADWARTFTALAVSLVDGPIVALDSLPTQGTELSLDMLTVRGMIHSQLGDFTAAESDFMTVSAGTKVHSTLFSPRAAIYLAETQYMLGNWDEAAIYAKKAVNICHAEHRTWSYPLAHMVASLVPAGRGDWKVAKAEVDSAIASVQQYPTLLGTVSAATAQAVLAQAQADYPSMLVALEPLRERPVDSYRYTFGQWWRVLLIEALLETGHVEEAGLHLDVLEDTVGDKASWAAALCWLRGRWTAAEGRVDEAIASFAECITSTSAERDLPFYRALLEQEYGRLLREKGQRSEAAVILQSSCARFAELGARPFVQRCEAITGSLGDSDAQDQNISERHPLFTLTQREREVSYLVARGMTNSEIAQLLFVSGKTVEYHLGHVYAKLGLSSRYQLRDAIQGHVEPA
jgi:DNA-binding CsgD family transcriptional regulator